MKKFVFIAALVVATAVSFTACKKKQPVTTDPSTVISSTTASTNPSGTTAPIPPPPPPVFVPDPNAPRNATIIQVATTQAISLGLSALTSGKQKSEVDDIAGKVNQVVNSSVLPYLNGSSGATSAGINGFINGQFVSLPSEAQSLISLAAMLLDQYLPAPSASSILNSDQLMYVKAFFQGIGDGTKQFVTSSVTASTPAAPVLTPANPVAVTASKGLPYVSTGQWFNPKK